MIDLEVFERIENFGMKLTPEKCSFFETEIQYLGVLISKSGSRPNPTKVKSISQISQPSNIKAIKSFLGAASYFRRFIPRFAIIAKPLHTLLSKYVPFIWTKAHETSFSHLKKALIQAPVLVSSSFGRPYIIHTDVSIVGLGACLLQANSTNSEHPMAYCSRSFNKHEKNYAVF